MTQIPFYLFTNDGIGLSSSFDCLFICRHVIVVGVDAVRWLSCKCGLAKFGYYYVIFLGFIIIPHLFLLWVPNLFFL